MVNLSKLTFTLFELTYLCSDKLFLHMKKGRFKSLKDLFLRNDHHGYKIRGESRTVATSKIELFVIIVNSLKPITIITKCSILDVAAVLVPPLNIMTF